MCDCCCDCSELEDAYEESIDALAEAQGKVWEYHQLLEGQKRCSEDLKDIIQDCIDRLEEIGVDPTIDYSYLISVIGLLSIKIAVDIALLILATHVLIEISETLETIWQGKLDEWQDKLPELYKSCLKLEKDVDDCYSSLIQCEGCGEEFWEKEECGRDCDGCGSWYCKNCFRESIEEIEVTAGHAI